MVKVYPCCTVQVCRQGGSRGVQTNPPFDKLISNTHFLQGLACMAYHAPAPTIVIHSLVPRPHHACEEKGLGTLERFLGLAHHHVTACAPIQTYASNHMIAELAEPKIGANVPRPFPCVRGGVRERD